MMKSEEIVKLFDSSTLQGKSPKDVATALRKELKGEGDDVSLLLARLLVCSRVRCHPIYDEISLVADASNLYDAERVTVGGFVDRYSNEEVIREILPFFASVARARLARVALSLGDVIEMPLINGEFVYGVCCLKSQELGTLFRIYRSDPLAKSGSLHGEAIGPLLMPAVYALKEGIYYKCGAIEGYEPARNVMFVSNQHAGKGRLGNYWLTTVRGSKELGRRLPDKYRSLELKMGWSLDLLEQRLIDGVNPFQWMYGD